MDIAEHIARIERKGFRTPADAALALQFMRVIRDLSNNAAELAKGVRAEMVTAAQAATMLGLIETLAQRIGNIEAQLAILQRQSTTTN